MSGDFTKADAPFALFAEWLTEASRAEVNDPNAMAIATVDTTGLPNVRMVLMKELDAAGFVFYTNYDSAKGSEIRQNNKAAGLFHWKSLRRQVRFRGPVQEVEPAIADAYFASRPRDSRIGAWASQQSRPLESRFALEKAVVYHGAKYAVGEVPRPPNWGGFRVVPLEIEFWHDRPFRLHDRIVFRRDEPSGPWSKIRLYP